MNDESKFSVDEILEAERKAKANGAPEETGEFSFLHGARALSFAQNPVEPAYAAEPNTPEESEKTTPGVTEEPDAVTEPETEQPVEEASAEVAQPAPEAEPQPVEVQEDSPWDTYEEEEEPGKKKKNKKEKKEKKGFWARRREKKQKEVFNEAEDMYYGIQLKPIDEYTRGFDATGEISTQDEGYRKLFDENTAELDDEVAKDFERLQKERRRRVAEAVETAGVDLSAVEDELGIVAPVPVSVAMNDPNAVVPENKKTKDKVQNFQTAMLQDAQTHTMEIKLDLENETFGLQQAKVVPEVSEDSVRRILESVQAENAAKQAAQVQNAEQQAAAAPKTEESDAPEMAFKDISSNGPEPEEEPQAEEGMDIASGEQLPEAQAPKAENVQAAESAENAENAGEEAAEPAQQKISVPVTDVTQYRKRDLPVHIINADVLQSALLSEARVYSDDENVSAAGAHRFKIRFAEKPDEAPENTEAAENSDELIDDYTGPADAKSVAHDLRTTMRELTIRMLATGVSTAVLILASLIAESGFNANNTETAGAVGYTILSLVLLLVAIGFCAKTILNGLKALFEFRANSDSAAAVACVAVFVQTLCTLFAPAALSIGKIHLYASIAAGILFLNTIGKLTMLRRIHSNFRFVSSREQKYAVRVFDDYNTSLKMAGSSVISQPAIAYQQKAGFLKRFLQISYEPDPAETSSQVLAPVGLISSLLLCVVALVITKDASLAITALAASCCVCVAVMNMLAVNLPVSRLSHRLRRRGAMVSGYEGIKRMSAVNAVLVDSTELFPRGTVVLNGVKPFKQEGLEEAVLAAGTLVQQLGGPLCGVFEQVFSEHEGELPEVEKAAFEAGNGVVGTVDGKEVLIGSRTLLTAHGVEAPEQNVESQYTTGSRQILYIAMGGELYAMFILTYNADRKKKAELQNMEMNGVSLILRSADPNLTPQFISRLFGIDATAVNVIGAGQDGPADHLVNDTADRVDAYAATKGRVESMMSLVSTCIDEKKNISFIVAMQNAAVVIGFVLVAFLTFVAGVEQISAFALVIYELFWVLATVLVPKFRNKVK